MIGKAAPRPLFPQSLSPQRAVTHGYQNAASSACQRRQVDPVQCADQGGHRRGELPVLHHRTERRHRAGAGSAPERAGGIINPQKVIPTAVEFVDIAGLVAGAASGEGLGNKFLAHIREVDAITHVVRCFEHGDIVHVAGKVDPISDIETIDTELALADLDSVEKALNRAERAAKVGDKDAAARKPVLAKLQAALSEARLGARPGWTRKRRRWCATCSC